MNDHWLLKIANKKPELMKDVKYQDLVRDGGKLSQDEKLLQGTLGLTHEAGKISALVKEHVCHGQELDDAQMLDGLSCVLLRLAVLSDAIGNTLSGIAMYSAWKLNQRYPDLYPDPVHDVRVVL